MRFQRKDLEMGRDYYLEADKVILTEAYLRSRGKCCDRGCRHCPYKKDFKSSVTG